MNLIKKQTNFIIFVFLKMEYFVFKVEEKIRSVSSENFQPCTLGVSNPASMLVIELTLFDHFHYKWSIDLLKKIFFSSFLYHPILH